MLAAGGVRAQVIGFDGEAAAGKPPTGWTLGLTGKGEARWQVEADPTAPSRPNVLRQSGKATYPVALLTGSSVTDGAVEVRFKAVAGTEDRAAGLVWRARDLNNYYIVRANALEDNVVLYKTVNGRRQSLDLVGQKGGYGTKAPVPAGEWHALRVEFTGARFKVVFNGRALFEVEDQTFAGPGMVGLWTKADSLTLFDDFQVTSAR
jgi:hypothetical protein